LSLDPAAKRQLLERGTIEPARRAVIAIFEAAVDGHARQT
jgi:hypothetical protein